MTSYNEAALVHPDGSRTSSARDFASSPLLVFWETTRACLLACKHCRAEAIEQPLPGQLSTDEGKALLESLTRFNHRPPVLILTGGDPFMRKDIFELAAYARSLGIPLGFAPSVTPKFTPERLAKIKRIGIKTISISLDGAIPATHDGIRGVSGHFIKTIQALDLLVKSGFTVQVNTTVMRDNVLELPEVAKLLHDLGVHIWEVFFLIKVGRGSEVAELHPSENEDVCHFLFDASRYGFVVRTVESPFFRRVVAWRKEAGLDIDPAARFGLGPLYERLTQRLHWLLGSPEDNPRSQTAGTRDGKGILFVSSQGDVYPAGFLPLPLGNVRETDVVEIYRENPLLLSIRAGEFGGRCGDCEYRDLCGGSRSRAFAHFGDALAEDPGCHYKPKVPVTV